MLLFARSRRAVTGCHVQLLASAVLDHEPRTPQLPHVVVVSSSQLEDAKYLPVSSFGLQCDSKYLLVQHLAQLNYLALILSHGAAFLSLSLAFVFSSEPV